MNIIDPLKNTSIGTLRGRKEIELELENMVKEVIIVPFRGVKDVVAEVTSTSRNPIMGT